MLNWGVSLAGLSHFSLSTVPSCIACSQNRGWDVGWRAFSSENLPPPWPFIHQHFPFILMNLLRLKSAEPPGKLSGADSQLSGCKKERERIRGLFLRPELTPNTKTAALLWEGFVSEWSFVSLKKQGWLWNHDFCAQFPPNHFPPYFFAPWFSYQKPSSADFDNW